MKVIRLRCIMYIRKSNPSEFEILMSELQIRTSEHLDNFVNFTSVLGYFILNSHVRIGIYHSENVQTQNFSMGGVIKARRRSHVVVTIVKIYVNFSL